MINIRRIYFDYAATTPVAPAVEKAMRLYWGRKFGNPGSLHFFGQEAIRAVDEAREKISQTIGADFREIIFTGSATEANNLALRGAVKKFGARSRIIVSAIEHESVLETAKDLGKAGAEVVYLPVNREGFVDLNELKTALNGRTALVSVLFANNEIGTIQPIAEIAEIIKEFRGKGVYPLFHTDAVQAFQYLDCDVNKLGVDLMTLSAHKIYGPKGIGVLYVRNQNLLGPIILGGGQEFGLRSGTENVPLMVGFAKAVELISNSRELENKRIRELRDYFWSGFKKIFKEAEINGGEPRLPNNLNVYCPGQPAQDFLTKLDLAGIAASAGSACASRSPKPSHVLQAMGFSEKRAKESLRFSFGRYTTETEIDEAMIRIKNFR